MFCNSLQGAIEMFLSSDNRVFGPQSRFPQTGGGGGGSKKNDFVKTRGWDADEKLLRKCKKSWNYPEKHESSKQVQQNEIYDVVKQKEQN